MKLMARLLNWISQAIIAGFMLVVLASAILSSVFSYYLPKIDEYRPEVLEIINNYSGNVAINAHTIRGSWAPFKPALTLTGVEIIRADWEAPLTFSSMHVELDMIKSLATGSWYFSNMSMGQLSLALAQADDGSWSLSAVTQDKSNQPFDLKAFVNRLWSIGRLHLDKLTLELHPKDTGPIELPSLEFEFTDNFGHHRLAARLKRDDKVITRLTLDAFGKPFTAGFRAKAFLDVNDLPLADITTFAKSLGALDKGTLRSRLWLDWQKDDFTVEGDIKLTDAKILLGKNKQTLKPFNLETLETQLSVEYKKGRLQAWFPDILLKNPQDQLDLDGLYLDYKDSLKAKLRTLDLAQVFSFSKQLPLSEKLHGILDQLAPSGLVTGLNVRYTPANEAKDQPWDFDYALRLVDINVNPWRSVPLLRSVNGAVFGDKFTGRVELDTHDLVMAFDQIYSTQMQFATARGIIGWSVDKDWVNIDGRNLVVDGVYGDVVGQFHVMLPANDEIKLREPARLSLDLGIRNGDAKYRRHLIPDKKLDPKLMSWLNNNILGGEISQGGFIFNGPVSKPKGKNALDEESSIQLWLELQNAGLRYLDGWPAITGVSGELLMDDLDVIADIDQASTAGMRLSDVAFTMKNVPRKRPSNAASATGRQKDQVIQVTGRARTATEKAIEFITLPVMPEETRKTLGSWDISGGTMDARLQINTRLQDPQDSLRVKLWSQLNKVNMAIPEANIAVKNINGPLNFDLWKGLSSPGFQATFLGAPVNAKMQATGRREKIASLLTFETDLNMAQISEWDQQAINVFMTGQSHFSGEVSFGGLDDYVKVSSNLKGIGVSLPAPFAKAADDERELTMTLPLKSGRREVVFQYGRNADIRFLMKNQGMEAAQINLGVNKVGYEKGAISVGGQLTDANVEAWMDAFKKYTAEEDALSSKRNLQRKAREHLQSVTSDAAAKGETVAKTPQSWHINVDKLNVRRIEAFGQVVYNSVLSIFNTQEYWQVLLEHAQFDGTLRVYNDDKIPMELDVNTVDLGLLLSDEKSTGIQIVDKEVTQYPAIDVNIDKLYWNGDDFGAWRFNFRANDKAIMLEKMFGSFKSMQLTQINDDKPAQVVWQLDGSETRIQGRLNGGNLANSLQLLGYQEEITSKNFHFDVEAYWPGQPTDFSVYKTQGYTELLFENGSFVNLDSSSASALKVLGILNLNLILKRLQLDFSDLSAKGLAYDEVKGRIDFDDGLFSIDKPLVVKSPSSQINLNGWADINSQSIDMTMGATLPLASNLPWLVALAGGLPTAAGVYVISLLLKKQVDALSSAVYSITGDLTDPTIKFEKLFDTGGGRYKEPDDPSKALDDPFPYE